MRTTNKTLAETFLQTWIPTNDLVSYFDIIIKLFKKYKKRIFDKEILDIIKGINEELYSILVILQHYNKKTLISIKNIISEIKQLSKDYTPTFTVNSIEENKDIEQLLEKKFPKCSVKKRDNLEVWVYIHWEWRYYKRNIDQDLQKLLW